MKQIHSFAHKTLSERRRQAGFLSVDFIFALVLVMSLSAVFLVLGFTLSVVEVAQYIAFSTSRAYFAGHLTVDKQNELGERKFAELLQTPGIGNLLKKKWFAVSPEIGDFADVYKADERERGNFIGVQLSFEAKVLEFSIPLFGSTAGTSSQGGFRTKINSFLGREPSSEECQKFMAQRWELIQKTLNTQVPAERYIPIDDNGC